MTIQAPENSTLSVRVVDSAGRLVRNLSTGTSSGVPQTFTWDGTASSGTRASAGTYFFVAEGEGRRAVARVVRLR